MLSNPDPSVSHCHCPSIDSSEAPSQAAVMKLAHGIFITGHGVTKAAFGNEQPCLGWLRRLGGGRLDPAAENLNLNLGGGGAVRRGGDQNARQANHRSP